MTDTCSLGFSIQSNCLRLLKMNKITVNTLMIYVNDTLDAKYRKNETECESQIVIVHRIEMTQCFFVMKAIRPDYLPFTRPSFFKKIWPRLTFHDYITPLSMVHRFKRSIFRLPRNELS